MMDHDTDKACPECGELMSLTTEWGWIDNQTCTAVMACPECRTVQGLQDDKRICRCAHAPTEEEALAQLA